MRRSGLVAMGLALILANPGCGDDSGQDWERGWRTEPTNDNNANQNNNNTNQNNNNTNPGDILLEGAVQKGPFVIGTSVKVSLLDVDLNPTGLVYNTHTINDMGEFDITFNSSGPVALEGVGYYYNEVIGRLSGSTLTLRAFYIPSAQGTQQAYINMITHLTTERIKALTGQGETFADAVAQAEQELQDELAITYPAFSPAVDAIDMNMAGGDTDDNAYLLAVSSVLAQVALMRGGSIEANIQEILNQSALFFALNGELPAQVKDDITAALLALDVGFVATKLQARFLQTGSLALPPDMHRVLDQDRDGIRNLDDNCPLVPNADQANADGDSFGDVCDDCPATSCADRCVLAADMANATADQCYTACEVDSDCAGAELCLKSGYLGLTRYHALSMCGAGCNPIATSPCSAGLGCFALEAQDGTAMVNHWSCIPEALHGDGSLGEGCADEGYECGSGLYCGNSGDFRYTACRALCDPDDPTACGGSGCTVIDPVDEAETDIGLCTLGQGALDSACSPAEGSDPDTCDPGLICANSIHCPTGADQCCVAAGGQDQPCDQADTCDGTALACVDNAGICPADPAGLPCCVEAQALGEECDNWVNATAPTKPCQNALVCNTAMDLCDPGQFTCCLDPVPEGGDCLGVQICGEGLICSASDPTGMGMLTICPNSQEFCCVQAGASNQPCRTDGSCEAGLACVGQICLASPGPCGVMAQCSPGLTCIDDACVPTGDEGQPCNEDSTCDDSGLACFNSMEYAALHGCSSQWPNGCCVVGASLGEACETGPCDMTLRCSNMGQHCASPPCCIEPLTEGADCDPYMQQGGNLCATGLSCLDAGQALGVCNQQMQMGCCAPTGEEGLPCNSDLTCNDPGLHCVGDQICLPQDGACPCNPGFECVGTVCIEAGDAKQPCNAGSTCDATTLDCMPNTCNFDHEECCQETGGLGEICAAGGTCDGTDLACVNHWEICANPLGYCCQQGADEGESCNLDSGMGAVAFCGPGLYCSQQDRRCYPQQDPGEECDSNQAACQTGYRCVGSHEGYCTGNQNSCCVESGDLGQFCNQFAPQCDTPGTLCLGDRCLQTTGTCPNCPGGSICVDGEHCIEAGGENQPCDTGNTCNGDLTCVSAICSIGTGACCIPSGGAFELCNPSGDACDSPNLECSSDAQICGNLAYSGGCCVDFGGDNGPCTDQQQCDSSDFMCVGSTMYPNGVCLHAGDEGEVCKSDSTCNAGFACLQDHMECENRGYGSNGSCCIPAGGEDEPCNGDGTCDSAELGCLNDPWGCEQHGLNGVQNCCLPGADLGGGCGQTAPCKAGLGCDGDAQKCVNLLPEGGDCYNQPICDAGLVCAQSWDPDNGCSTSSGSCCVQAGDAGEPCLQNGTCNAGLACMEGRCVQVTGNDCMVCDPATERCINGWCAIAGGDGEACLTGDVCTETNSLCLPSMQGQCPSPYENSGTGCCVGTGGLDERCTNGTDCDGDLTCEVLGCSNGLTSCCRDRGSENDLCNTDDTCDSGDLVCYIQGCPNGLPNCCLAQGGENQPCNPGDTCDTGDLTCMTDGCPNGLANCCLSTGGDGERCNAGGTCDTGDLTCVTDSMVCSNGQPDCCIQTGEISQPCNPDSTCDATALGCSRNNDAVCGWDLNAWGCCITGRTEGLSCNDQNPCQQGLACDNNVCVQMVAEGGECPGGAEICEPGLRCLMDGDLNHQCPSGFSYCCAAAGDGGEPCFPNNSCDAGLSCQSQRCFEVLAGDCMSGQETDCPNGGVGEECLDGMQCVAGGGLSEFCDGTCDSADHACVESHSEVAYLCPDTMGHCCVEAGGPDEPCKPGNQCDTGLTCSLNDPSCPEGIPDCCLTTP